MKIIDGLKLRGFPAEIPDCGRDDLPGFFKEMGYTTGAEIGVLRGEYSEKLCQAGLQVFAVDPWKNHHHYHRHPKEESYEELYEITRKRLEPYNATIVRKPSIEAADDFKDLSLDFVYIDGNHILSDVVTDIYEWYRKVRIGGALAGHDYGMLGNNPYHFQAGHVEIAVKACAQLFKIGNFYVLGEKYSKNRDKWRSWMFVK